MTETRANRIDMDCFKFQERLPELIGSHSDLTKEEHLTTCENCAALVRDLQYIADQAKLLLPMHDPSPEVWEKIERAMEREPAVVVDGGMHGNQPPV
jgi:hypothetical protein